MSDVLIIGAGGIGTAAALHLARRGARVVALDRFAPGHDRGSSHGQTRIIRQAYFEHTDYVPLLRRAYRLWRELEKECGVDLFHQVGVVQVGPSDGPVLRGVRSAAAEHRLEVEELSARDVESRWPAFRVPESLAALFEPTAGYLRVEECVAAHAGAARRAGAELRHGVTVEGWRADGAGVAVTTDQGTFRAARLVVAPGAWAPALLADLGVPLEVRRKPLFWFAAADPRLDAAAGFPGFLFEMPTGVFYGFPRLDPRGLKVAEHSGGTPVDDPLAVDRARRPADEARLAEFLAAHLPDVSRRVTDHTVCMYTMTPDEHFLVGRHPRHAQVVLCAGLSGHGFKFAPVLGEAVAELTLTGRSERDVGVEFLGAGRMKDEG